LGETYLQTPKSVIRIKSAHLFNAKEKFILKKKTLFVLVGIPSCTVLSLIGLTMSLPAVRTNWTGQDTSLAISDPKIMPAMIRLETEGKVVEGMDLAGTIYLRNGRGANEKGTFRIWYTEGGDLIIDVKAEKDGDFEEIPKTTYKKLWWMPFWWIKE
jgi:hypothetical protein